MKIKQISLVAILPTLIVGSVFSALLVPAKDVSALNQQEKKACYEKWAGRSSVGDGRERAFNENEFNRDKCSTGKNGSCKIVRTGSVGTIQCQKRDGSYDSGVDGWDNSTPGESDSNPNGSGSTGDDCAGVETAIIKCTAKNSGSVEDNGIWALLLLVINIMTAGVGVLAVAGIVYGAVLYTTAEDKADQVKKATDIITNVIIGLVAFALMWAGLNFIIPGGVFA